MAICFRCNKSEKNHEIEMPSKGYEIQRGKKVETCEGFQSFDPKLLEKPDAPTLQATVAPIPVNPNV